MIPKEENLLKQYSQTAINKCKSIGNEGLFFNRPGGATK